MLACTCIETGTKWVRTPPIMKEFEEIRRERARHEAAQLSTNDDDAAATLLLTPFNHHCRCCCCLCIRSGSSSGSTGVAVCRHSGGVVTTTGVVVVVVVLVASPPHCLLLLLVIRYPARPLLIADCCFLPPYLSLSLILDPLDGDGAPAHCLVGKGTHGRSPLPLSFGGGTKQ